MKPVRITPILVAAAFCAATSQPSGARPQTNSNPLAGTWNANLSKSKRDPNHQFQSAALHIEVSGDTVLLNYSGVNMSGQQESGTTKLNPDGKEYPVPEVTGFVQVARWVDSNTLEMTAKKDGKVVGQAVYQVSPDRKTLTARLKGIDASGGEFEQVIVFDRQ